MSSSGQLCGNCGRADSHDFWSGENKERFSTCGYAAAWPERGDSGCGESIYDSTIPEKLSLLVGVTTDGEPFSVPLEGRSLGLIAGIPGSGKTELLASLFVGMTRQDNSGQSIQLAIIDIKRCDFSAVNDDLACLAMPVTRDKESALEVISRLNVELEQRYAVLQESGCKHIEEFNAISGEERVIPYLVCIVDEYTVTKAMAG